MNFKILDQNGTEVVCDIVAIFQDENTNTDYIIYTDGTKGETGKLEVYASRYKKDKSTLILEDIENESEWDLIDDYLAYIDKR